MEPPLPTRPALSGLQRIVLGGLGLALAGSVALRVLTGSDGGESTLAPMSSSFVGDASVPNEGAGLERFLPYLTEASFFGLIGFALGYATRKVFKLALLLIAAAFIVVQLLVSTGHIAVDWLGVRSAINQFLFNLKENESITAFLKNRIPSAGALLAGWYFGFRRG